MIDAIIIRGDLDVTPIRPHPSQVVSRFKWFWNPKLWILNKPLFVTLLGHEFEMPCNWIFDFASVPRLLKPFVPDDALYGYAAAIHDYLYKTGILGKWLADAVFAYLLVKVDKIHPVIAGIMWLMVVLFGQEAFNKHRRRENLTKPLSTG